MTVCSLGESVYDDGGGHNERLGVLLAHIPKD